MVEGKWKEGGGGAGEAGEKPWGPYGLSPASPALNLNLDLKIFPTKSTEFPKIRFILSPRALNYRGDIARVGDSLPQDGNSVFDLTVALTVTLTPLAQSKPASLSALCHQPPPKSSPA
jgi:hypothetical protein